MTERAVRKLQEAFSLYGCASSELQEAAKEELLRRNLPESLLVDAVATFQSATPPKQVVSQPSSFSLFADNINLSFLRWNELKKDTERLEKLGSLQYLDDIVPDWPVIRSFLQEQRPSSQLYRHLYAKSRDSSDYQTIQVDILTDLLDRNEQASMETAVEIFQDVCNRSSLPEARQNEVGQKIWAVASRSTRYPFSTTWVRRWMANLPPYQVKQVVLDTRHGGTSLLQGLVDCLSEPTRNGFAIESLTSILEVLRVSQFPWDAVSLSRVTLTHAYLRGILDRTDNAGLESLQRGLQVLRYDTSIQNDTAIKELVDVIREKAETDMALAPVSLLLGGCVD